MNGSDRSAQVRGGDGARRSEAPARRSSRAQPSTTRLQAFQRRLVDSASISSLPDEGQLPDLDSPRISRRRDMLYRRALGTADICAAAFGVVASVSLLGPDTRPRLVALLLVPLVLVGCKAAGLYERDENVLRRTTLDEVPKLLPLSLIFALAVWVGQAYLVDGKLTRLQVVGTALLTFASLMVLRSLARRAVRIAAPVERCLVLGDHDSAEHVHGKFQYVPGLKAAVIGRIPLHDDDAEQPGDAVPVVGTLDMLGLTLEQHEVERVLIAPNGNDSDEILDAIRLVKGLGVKVSVLPRLLEVVGSSATFEDIHGISLLGVRRYGLSRSSDFLKRATDLAIALVGLVVIAPLLATIALAIRLTSRGPVLFRQPRIGRNGEQFDILKFRSMVDGADALKPDMIDHNEAAEGLFKISDDPRITTAGRFLRRTSLDELPQLFNVIKGDMSLVGPRPLVPDEDVRIEGWRRRRLVVRPGMTGLWQIFGSSRIPVHEMVKIDYLYGANWSLWLDVKILLRTLPYMLDQRGM